MPAPTQLSSRILPALLLASSLALVAGCAPKVTVPTTVAAASALPAPILTPLSGAALRHPTPGNQNAPLNLDAAETRASQHLEDVNAQRDAAYCYYRLQAFVQAVPAFQKVLVLAPNSVSDRLYLGYAQMAAGTLDDAVATFLAVTSVKGVTPADTSSAYLEIGSCDLALQRDDQASEAFARSLAADAHQGMASLGLGTYDAAKGKTAEARIAFTNAARDLPRPQDRAKAYACLGRLDEEAKKPTVALGEYRQALALDARNSWARKALARLGGSGGKSAAKG